MVSAIIVAAGSSQRMGADKLLAPLAGKPLLLHTLAAFNDCGEIDEVILVTREDRLAEFSELLQGKKLEKVQKVIAGGRERHDSVWNGLQAVSTKAGYIAIHDAARPLVTPGIIGECLALARKQGAACCAVPVSDTVKRASSEQIVEGSVDRDGLWVMQTPQVFEREIIMTAYQAVRDSGEKVTDEVSAVQKTGKQIHLLRNDEWNFKVTFPRDLEKAEQILLFRGVKG